MQVDRQWAREACRQADRRPCDEVRYTGHERGAHQRLAQERIEWSEKKGAHEAPALLTKIWPQRGERDARGHKESRASS